MSVNLTQTAKELGKKSTDAERLLWSQLKAKQLEGLKFRRQEQIGRFIADLVCYEKSVIIGAMADSTCRKRKRTKSERRGFQCARLQGAALLESRNFDKHRGCVGGY